MKEMSVAGVKLVKTVRLGKIIFIPAAPKRPHANVCRGCGGKTDFDLTTEKVRKDGVKYTVPCCPNQSCYDQVVIKNFPVH